MPEYSVVGKPLPRVDGVEKALGSAVFTADISLPGMLHGKILRSPHPHARILHIDTGRGERLPGVKAIITGKDVAGVRYAFVDTPRYPADETPLAVDRVRYVGDEVAAVVATDEEVALEALDLIRVEYAALPAVFHPEEAMKAEAPRLHDGDYAGTSAWEDWGAQRTATSVAEYEFNNLSGKTFFTLGDVQEGFRRSYRVHQDRFETQVTAHAALEPHAVVGSYDPFSGKVDVWVSGMGVFYKRFILAKALGLPTSKVRIRKTYCGGAFGGKVDVFSHEFCAAYLSRMLGKPVKIELSREEVFTVTRQRHPMIIEIRTGVDKDGVIQAQDIKVIADNGAYRGTGAVVIFLCHAFSNPIYKVPNYRYTGYSVYTNNPIRGAQRAHGAPQIRFAIDSQLDIIARDLGLDPVEVMLRNARQVGDVLPNGDVLESCGLSRCIRGASEKGRWAEKRAVTTGGQKKRGIGISACSMFSGGAYYPFASAAIVALHDDGAVTLYTGSVEMGQGSETTLSQVAAEELGVTLGDIRLVSGDTELCPVDMGSWLSGGALVTGTAVKLAAADARSQLLEVASQMLEANAQDLEARGGRIYVKGSSHKGISFAEAVHASVMRNNGNPVVGKGYRKIVPEVEHYPSLAKAKGRFTDAYGFATHVAEVEVDIVTGEVAILRTTTFHDCGFALNPVIVEGQVDGCVSMGAGQSLLEEGVLEEGRLLNPSFLNYELPVAMDTAHYQTGVVESVEPKGPFGAKEVGEGALAGMLAAVANAVYDAVGVRIKSLPVTPDKILQELYRQRSG